MTLFFDQKLKFFGDLKNFEIGKSSKFAKNAENAYMRVFFP